jgi:enamine deaminase RidA (YjgF/YER057c/UK114 family)
MTIERLSPAELRPSDLYSHVVRTGNMVFIAGQVAQDADGHIVGAGDFQTQAAQVFDNLSAALASVGASLGALVKITIYITDSRFRDPLREINRRYLPTDQPTSTLLVVAGLARPEYLIEIDAVAALD